jgi:hypothetical protein
MEEEEKDGFRPEGGAAMSFGASRRCCRLTRASESGDHAVLLGLSCRSRSHGWIPMAADSSVDRWRRFFACRIHPRAGLRGIPCARPSASVSRLRLCFVVPAVTDIATWRKPQNMLVQTNRAGARLRFRFRLSSVNTTVACPVM